MLEVTDVFLKIKKKKQNNKFYTKQHIKITIFSLLCYYFCIWNFQKRHQETTQAPRLQMPPIRNQQETQSPQHQTQQRPLAAAAAAVIHHAIFGCLAFRH